MKGTSHLIVGGATGYILSQQINSDPITTIGLTMIGSIIVDIDEPNSKINKLLFMATGKYVNYIKAIIGGLMFIKGNPAIKYIGAIILLSIIAHKTEYRFQLFKGIEKRKYHRTLFHDPLIGSFIFIYPMMLLNLPIKIMLPLVIGIVSHYICDMFTSYGLPLYLFRTKLRSPIHFKSTNKIAENLTVGLIVIGLYYLNNIEVINKVRVLMEQLPK